MATSSTTPAEQSKPHKMFQFGDGERLIPGPARRSTLQELVQNGPVGEAPYVENPFLHGAIDAELIRKAMAKVLTEFRNPGAIINIVNRPKRLEITSELADRWQSFPALSSFAQVLHFVAFPMVRLYGKKREAAKLAAFPILQHYSRVSEQQLELDLQDYQPESSWLHEFCRQFKVALTDMITTYWTMFDDELDSAVCKG